MSSEFRNGVAFTIAITAFAFVVIAMVVGNNNNIPIAEPSADVVGTYKECDIIRWTNNQLAEYKYFLYCEKNK
ncbi:hypothetical protein SRSM4_178 [Synechococcus phage S-RSM4]|uniref:Uncharacterized protein n=1 Tax=Synechococcus phage S-RSM4 TaxID=555387 RepID=C7BVE6_9CAUD|nr:hypothetical protein SRSM4_178 [Synechococcus phage S-RSM4]CAR63375.1 hypothetical protein SRSM4_178 [Synechococcus phage S-RSM4]